MRLAALLPIVASLGASAPALAVQETAEGFAAAMQGCWNQIGGADGASSQLCLKGGIEGDLTVYDCVTHGDLTECATMGGSYAFKDEKFWRSYVDGPLAGGLDNCDVRLEAGKQVDLHNCQWTTEPTLGAMAEDAVYEKAVGQ